LLVGSGLWNDEAGLQKKLVKINTSLVYRQDKYNLLREETEGYSKLFTVLSTMPSLSEDPSSHITHIFSIIGKNHPLLVVFLVSCPLPPSSIGYFDLDPNRVLDLILDTMEHQIWNLSFLLVLKQFRKSSIAHILGFKFTQFKTASLPTAAATPTAAAASPSTTAPSTPTLVASRQQENDLQQSSISTPESLFALTAILLTTKLISLEQILPYFSPNFHDIQVLVTEKSSQLQEEIKAYGVVNLTKKSETKSATPSTIGATAAATDSSPSSGTPSPFVYADGYQLVGLLAATLTIRNWTLAQELLQLIKLHTSMSPCPPPPLSSSRSFFHRHLLSLLPAPPPLASLSKTCHRYQPI
jgi:THO complex subunit 2